MHNKWSDISSQSLESCWFPDLKCAELVNKLHFPLEKHFLSDTLVGNVSEVVCLLGCAPTKSACGTTRDLVLQPRQCSIAGGEAPAFSSLGCCSNAAPKFDIMKCMEYSCTEEGEVQRAGLMQFYICLW